MIETKHKKQIKIRILALALVMAVVLSGCDTFNSFRHAFLEENDAEEQRLSAVPTITIGIFEAQTGSSAAKGEDVIKGIELANSIYSNVNGYDVKLVKVDTQSKAATAETAIDALIAMKPVAIIGSSGEATSLVASDNIKEAQIPAITPSATNPLITQTNGYYFRGCLTESQMGEGLAEYAYNELASRKIGTISLKNDSRTAAVLSGFSDKIQSYNKKRSDSILQPIEIGVSIEEMSQALDTVKESKCTTCLVSLGNEAMDDFFYLVEEKKMTNLVFLGTKGWGDASFVQMMKKHPNIRVVFPYSSVLSANSRGESNLTMEAERFQIEYQIKYGSRDIPTESAALGYDAYLLLINAINAAPSLEGEDIRESLANIKKLQCVTGVFEFDDKGSVIRTVTLSTIDIEEGKIIPYYVTKEKTEAKELEDLETQQAGAQSED